MGNAEADVGSHREFYPLLCQADHCPRCRSLYLGNLLHVSLWAVICELSSRLCGYRTHNFWRPSRSPEYKCDRYFVWSMGLYAVFALPKLGLAIRSRLPWRTVTRRPSHGGGFSAGKKSQWVRWCGRYDGLSLGINSAIEAYHYTDACQIS